jgi:hypothetical protein
MLPSLGYPPDYPTRYPAKPRSRTPTIREPDNMREGRRFTDLAHTKDQRRETIDNSASQSLPGYADGPNFGPNCS